MSIIDLFEDMKAPAFPVIFPRLACIWNLRRDDGDPEVFEGTMRIQHGEASLYSGALAVNFQGQRSTRIIVILGGIQISSPGQVVVEWSVPGVVDSRYVIDVSVVPQEVNQAIPANAATMMM